MPIFLDADPVDRDWTKANTWDLPTDPGEFYRFMGGSYEEWTQFKQSVAYRAMPKALYEQVEAMFGPKRGNAADAVRKRAGERGR